MHAYAGFAFNTIDMQILLMLWCAVYGGGGKSVTMDDSKLLSCNDIVLAKNRKWISINVKLNQKWVKIKDIFLQ